MNPQQTLRIGDLAFDLRRSPRRKTVEITIERDGSLVIRAPSDCPAEAIERVARGKQLWIYRKLAERQRLAGPGKAREYVSGESFYYLGRSYRLQLVAFGQFGKLSNSPLRQHQGRYLLRPDDCQRARQQFIDWYTRHGLPWLGQRVTLIAQRLDAHPRAVEIGDLGYSWGDCAPDGTIRFHWRAMLLPPRIIDYLITHELVHLLEPHHSPAFWQCLGRALPDYPARKEWLAQHGGEYD
ncbi:MAG: M48 family metallopeptidase [Chloroflexi bacterium]|nr:M48 family metallopeptidase [Chloroflexota bacterium]